MNRSLCGIVAASVLGCCVVFQMTLASAADITTGLRPEPGAETAADRDQRMKWWREARFGMFIHWGIYSVPAGEYKGQQSKHIGEWIMEWANIPVVEYEQFAAQFNPVKFNAAEW